MARKLTPSAASVAKHRRLMKQITGVSTACNAHAATMDKQGTYFWPITAALRQEITERIGCLVARIEGIVLAEYGNPLKIAVRLDERKNRRRSRGGKYHSKWQTENRATRVRDQRQSGVSLGLGGYLDRQAPDPADWTLASTTGGQLRKEYDHISPWGDVGSIAAGVLPWLPLDLVVAHECAHAVQVAEAVHGMPVGAPHGVEFCTHYSLIRRRLGMVAPGGRLWSDLPADLQAMVANSTRAIPPELLELAASDPVAYRREKDRLKMQARRAKAQAEKVAAGQAIKRGRPKAQKEKQAAAKEP